MSVPRGSMDNRESTEEKYENDVPTNPDSGEENVLKLMDKLLKKNEARKLKQDALLSKAIQDMELAISESGDNQSKDSEKLVDELKNIYKEASDKKSQWELRTLNKRMQDISDVIEHSDNIQGVELKHMENLIRLTKDQINDKRATNAVVGAIKDSAKYVWDNAVDITAITSGLLTNSPLVTFASKMLMDAGSKISEKRKEIRENKKTRLAEQLEEHQREAYLQRKKLIEDAKAEKEAKLRPSKRKQRDDDEYDDSPIRRQRDDDESPIRRQRDDDSPLPSPEYFNIDPIVQEQERTNKILEDHLQFIVRDSAHDTENKRESEDRQRKLFEMLKPRREEVKDEKGGFLGKIGKFLEAIPGIGPLLRIGLPAIGTFFTVSLIPALTGMMASFAAAIPIIIAVTGIVAAVTGMISGFVNAEERLGKESVTMKERIGSAIGGIMEGFGGLVDLTASLFGIDTDYRDWWNKNFTRPLADFIENFSITKYLNDALDWMETLPGIILDKTKTGMGYFIELITGQLFLKGLYKIAEKLNIIQFFEPYIKGFYSFVEKYNPFSLMIDIYRNIYDWLDEKFNITDKIKSILAPLNIPAMIEGIKSAILKYIPDFLLSDEQEALKKKNVPKTEKEVVQELEKKEVVEYNKVGKSEVKDWDAINKLSPEEIKQVINFDDWDNDTRKKLESIQREIDNKPDTEKPVVKKTIKETIEKPIIKETIEKDKKIIHDTVVDQSQKLKVSIPADQPDISRKIVQTSDINTYDKVISDMEKKKEKSSSINPIVQPFQNVTQNSSVMIPAMPYNQERGIRDLQRTFAV